MRSNVDKVTNPALCFRFNECGDDECGRGDAIGHRQRDWCPSPPASLGSVVVRRG